LLDKRIYYIKGGVSMSEVKRRVLLGKPGLDGHDKGMNVISAWLRDAGIEIVYLGPFQTAEKIVKSAIQEDVDVIGLSFLGGGHLEHVQDILAIMKENNLDIPIAVGGIIPKEDIPQLKEMGVKEVFPPNSPMESIVDCINKLCSSK
jgi:methylmalonyl-CoA mutase C-terminal domain/subunit